MASQAPRHDHDFEDLGNGVTRMRDVINFASPFGVLGRVIDRLVLKRYLKNLIFQRSHAIKHFLEQVA